MGGVLANNTQAPTLSVWHVYIQENTEETLPRCLCEGEGETVLLCVGRWRGGERFPCLIADTLLAGGKQKLLRITYHYHTSYNQAIKNFWRPKNQIKFIQSKASINYSVGYNTILPLLWKWKKFIHTMWGELRVNMNKEK